MDTRTLLLGDWHPWLRDPVDAARYAYAAAAVVWAFAHGVSAAGVVAAAVAVVVVRFLELPRPYDAAFVVALTLTGWGEALRLYDAFVYYDAVVHVLVPLFASQILYVTLARADLVPDPADETTRLHYAGIFVVTLALGLASGALWEMLEFAADHSVGSSLQLGLDDTMGDLAADLLGATLGGVLLVAWALYGAGTVRRPPADARHLAPYQERGGHD